MEKFEKREAHPMAKYIGRLAWSDWGEVLEVVGYTEYWDGSYSLIVDATLLGGWCELDAGDVVFKDCDSYLYVSINNLID